MALMVVVSYKSEGVLFVLLASSAVWSRSAVPKGTKQARSRTSSVLLWLHSSNQKKFSNCCQENHAYTCQGVLSLFRVSQTIDLELSLVQALSILNLSNSTYFLYQITSFHPSSPSSPDSQSDGLQWSRYPWF
jgi:hypothetical protein